MDRNGGRGMGGARWDTDVVGSSLLLLGEFHSVAEDLDSLLLMTGSTCLGKLTVEAEHLPAPERTQQTTTVHKAGGCGWVGPRLRPSVRPSLRLGASGELALPRGGSRRLDVDSQSKGLGGGWLGGVGGVSEGGYSKIRLWVGRDGTKEEIWRKALEGGSKGRLRRFKPLLFFYASSCAHTHSFKP